jgi:hypothetical protein
MLMKKIVTYLFCDLYNWEFGIEVLVPREGDRLNPSLTFYVGPLEFEIVAEDAEKVEV